VTDQRVQTATNILLVEDDPDDVMFMQRALNAVCDGCKVHHAENGEVAMAFLNKAAGHETAPTPSLVLLDLNMPRMSGFDVLREVQSLGAFSSVTFVVLSTVNDSETTEKALDLGAAAFHSKPVTTHEREELVRELLLRWCGGNEFPA
jgi:CheY-like chemotaxis protein